MFYVFLMRIFNKNAHDDVQEIITCQAFLGYKLVILFAKMHKKFIGLSIYITLLLANNIFNINIFNINFKYTIVILHTLVYSNIVYSSNYCILWILWYIYYIHLLHFKWLLKLHFLFIVLYLFSNYTILIILLMMFFIHFAICDCF